MASGLAEDGALAFLLLKHGALTDIRDANDDSAAELGVFELAAAHESAMLAAEAEARARAREARQRAELAAEQEAARREWQERLAEAHAYDHTRTTIPGPGPHRGPCSSDCAVSNRMVE